MPAKSHGLSTFKNGRKIYRAWLDIKRRCYNQSNKHFPDYGGRGIKLADYWLYSPEAFYEYVLALPDFSLDRSIDRIDNNSSYEKGNIRWATAKQQVANRRLNKNNTSGVKNVTWYFNKSGGTRAVSWWDCGTGKLSKSKSFPEKKYGLAVAFKMAILHQRAVSLGFNN